MRRAATSSGGKVAEIASAWTRRRWLSSRLSLAATAFSTLAGVDTLAEKIDQRRQRMAVGTRAEVQRHAVLEDRTREREHVVDRRRQPSLQQRAGTRRLHQGL